MPAKLELATSPVRRAVVLVCALLALAATGNPNGDSLSAEELAARRARIAAMDPDKQQDLLRKFERFSALPEEEQQRLRALQAAITADPSSERLLLVLERYHEWLKTINTTQRAKLAEMPVKERIEAIEHLRRTQRDAQRLEPLTRDDMRDIRRWVDELVELHRDELVAGIHGRARDWYNRQSDPSSKHMALVYRLFGRSRGGDESKVSQQDLDRLTQKLSESARGELAEAGTLEEQRRLVRGWIFASLRRSSEWRSGRRNNPVVGEELLQFLQTEVPPAERERLLQKPREEMLQELRKMYFERSGGPPRGSFDGRSGRDRPEYRRGRPDGPRGESPERPGEKPRPAEASPASPDATKLDATKPEATKSP